MDLEKTLRAACALHEPAPDFEDAVMARVSAASWRASRARPRKRHVFVIAALLVSVAAAAMLGSAIRRVMAPQAVVQSGAPRSLAEGSVPSSSAAAVTAPVLGSFTVHLRSLTHDSTDGAVQGKWQEYYAAIADGLRAVPGLQLIEDGATETAGDSASYRITIDNPDAYTAGQMLTKGEWAATFKVEVLKAGVYLPAQGNTRGGAFSPGSVAAQTTGGPLSGSGCHALILCSPADIAEWQIKDLRMQVFPLDAGLEPELEARFLDSARPVHEHFQALNDLHAMWARTGRAMSPAVVREALRNLASAQSDDRSLLWYYLSGQKDPQIIQPLIDAAQQDPDDWGRLGAIGQLATDFRKDPAARTVLQSIARRDPQLLNRKVAERALSGDGPWNEYVVATVKDTTQSVKQRLEPLHWMMIEQSGIKEARSGVDPMTSLSVSIFGKDRQAFIDLVVQAGRETNGSISNWILRSISSMRRPESSGFLLAVFDAVPDSGHLLLLADHLAEPRVRQRVEALAADPASPSLQATAAGMLDSQPAR